MTENRKSHFLIFMLVGFILLVLLFKAPIFFINPSNPDDFDMIDEIDEIELIFLVEWPTNDTSYFSRVGGYDPLQDPPSIVRIVRSKFADGYEGCDDPEWEILEEFPLTYLEGSNGSYSATGMLSTNNLTNLAAFAGIPSNYFDGKVAVKLSAFQNGDTVLLYYMKARFGVG